MVTIATVGYGDLTPETTTGKLFTTGFIVIGIGLFVAFARTFADHPILRARENLGFDDGEQDTDE